jgi:hypothetical protein
MRKDADPRLSSRQLHPRVYAAIAGLALCYVLAVWFGFAGSEYTDYLLTIASFFVLGAMALPLVAWQVWRANRDSSGTRGERSFRQWARGDFEIGQGHVSGGAATVEILLPIGAVAFGMLAFAILARLAG